MKKKKTGDNPYLHTEEAHKDWYQRPIMGRLGDKRGVRLEDTEKESLETIRKKVQKDIKK